ncbi:MAG: aspartate/glutamate racemase family protein [Halopseudomonas aestusnigri]
MMINDTTPFSILVINPNSSQTVTQGIERGIESLKNLYNANITCTQIENAPKAIETKEHIAEIEPLISQLISKSNADAFVIACFSDPGVSILRQSGVSNIYGIAECGMLIAAGQPGPFGIISILPASIPRHALQVSAIGLGSRLAGDVALNLGVLELDNQDLAKPRLEKIGKQLRDEMGAKSLILGCAGMAGYRNWLQDILGIPVIDPCRAAVSIAVGTMGTLQT